MDYDKIVNTTDRTKIEKEFAIEEVKAKQDGFYAIFGIESCYETMKVLNFMQYYLSKSNFLFKKLLKISQVKECGKIIYRRVSIIN